jgi:uncharacterized membrane protein YfcA
VAWPLVFLLPLIFLGALLYSSVGHGGATSYLAVLTLAGYATGPLTTTVLVLNILAAGIAFLAFRQAGHLRWRLLLPFLVTSVPAAYLGGLVPLSGHAQALLLGVALLLAAARLLLLPRLPNLRVPTRGPVFWVVAPALGALLGFLAGATGIGGGIFLSPVLLVMGWADVREAGSVASAFIVVNSLAGLAAKLPQKPLEGAFLVPMAAVVIPAALLGSWLGAKRLNLRALQVLLGLVLLLAGLKSVLG